MTQVKDLYNDTFNNNFVKNFPQVKPWLESEIPNLASKIDIEKAFSLMGYKIRMKDLHTDAYSELVGNVLYVNSNTAVIAQRYAIANTIGKLIMEQYANANTIGKLIMEQYANALAQQLLMPKIVVQQTIRYAIETQHLDQNYLSEDDYKLILSDSSKILGVSYKALDYRVKNLQLFETSN